MSENAESSQYEERAGLQIIGFADEQALQSWLEEHHKRDHGIWLKVGKKGNPNDSVTYDDAVMAALSYGWIDGQINRYNEHWYLLRFTPRRKRSVWSLSNCQRVDILIAQGRMRPAGLAAVEAAKADGRWDRAYRGQATAEVPADFAAAVAANEAAAEFFGSLTRSERYPFLYRLIQLPEGLKREKKIDDFVALLERGKTS
ncbi:MAG: YdeI/OmpD-associated family protein [Candidatus Nanopelagicales bacterium]